MLKEACVSPFCGQKLPFSGPSTFKLATSDLIFGDKICMDRVLDVVLCY